MPLTITLKKSSLNGKRPTPGTLAFGELALNYSNEDPGVYYKLASGSLQKVGNAQVSSQPPNSSGLGSPGISEGEFWYATGIENPELRIYAQGQWKRAGGGLATPLTEGNLVGCSSGLSDSRWNVGLGYGILSSSLGEDFLGQENVAIGSLSMGNRPNENVSVAVGYGALQQYSPTVTDSNVAIGHSAASQLQDGSANVYLGTRSGGDQLAGTGNVVIGNGATTSRNDSDHELVIGTDFCGNWITGDESRNVKLGAGLRDSVGSLGTPGQVLASTGTAIQWGTFPLPDFATPTEAGQVYGSTITDVGGGNTTLGFCSGFALAAGSKNTAVGALSLSTTANTGENTAIGYYSLKANTSGRFNVAVGSCSALCFTVSQGITAVGSNSLQNLTGPVTDRNTAVGQCAGFNITSGTDNTAIGACSMVGTAGTTGCRNIAVGVGSAANLTTGCNNVVIGTDVPVPSPTASCQLVIGGSANLTWMTGNSAGNVQFPCGVILDSAGNPGNTGQYLSRGAGNTLTWVNGVGNYVLPCASTTVLGGVRVDGTTITINSAGVISTGSQTVPLAAPSTPGLVCAYVSNPTSGNLGFGSQALANPTNGSGNTGIGVNALTAVNTGFGNTAVGRDSMKSMISGQNNIALGYCSLSSNTTGRNNVALGYCALASNVCNWGNIAIGESALRCQNDPSQPAGRNIAIGCQALSCLTTGNSNIAIGSCVGNGIQTGSGNVIIGNNIELSTLDGNFQLVIGSSAIGGGVCGNWLRGDSAFNICLVNGVRDGSGCLGTAGQVLSSTGSKTSWIDVSIPSASPSSLGTVLGFTQTDGSTLIGSNAGLNLSAGSTDVVAIGNKASCCNSGSFNTSVGSESQECQTGSCGNTSVGACALRVGSGILNTAVGLCSARCVTIASGVTAMGAGSLSTTVTTGDVSCNTAIGFCSLASNTTGPNTALGGMAGRCTTTGINNTFVGKSAGEYNVAGSRNTSVGHCALRNGSNFNGNTAIGAFSMCGNGTENNNTSVGACSLQGGGGVNQSVALGAFALKDATGGDNIAIGFQAGCSITTGTRNVVIGTNAQVDSPTGSGQLFIGYGSSYWICGDINQNIRFGGGFRDTAGNLGSSGQFLGSTGTGTAWGNPGVYGSFTVRANGNNLDFVQQSTNTVLMRLTDTGDLIVRGNITAYQGTIV